VCMSQNNVTVSSYEPRATSRSKATEAFAGARVCRLQAQTALHCLPPLLTGLGTAWISSYNCQQLAWRYTQRFDKDWCPRRTFSSSSSTEVTGLHWQSTLALM
jgi:hypothetical protein